MATPIPGTDAGHVPGRTSQVTMAELAKPVDMGKNSVQTAATAAHPGIASTEMSRKDAPPIVDRFFSGVLGRTPAQGALPTLRAATDPAAVNGDFFGPGGFLGIVGAPAKTRSGGASHDEDLQRQLWKVSEESTGVTYHFPPA
ncbi:hypothetical protein SAMN04489732_10335 [Amycolatopsis saalfeldensis]|uniref:Short chain dehydrogenase n=1 Tax=Amycolatopsis saalfeldensis TaxID=394193 RepID=A0A1H8U3C5_9PSEU|nr:hypothetical protein SAMN04489732_10335 [Amycolatopsis saalfeldensis]